MRKLVVAPFLLVAFACNQDKPTTPPEDATPATPVAESTEVVADAPPAEPADPRADHTRVCEEEKKAEVCTALAVMWERGREGDQDETKARAYYQMGCDGGHALACSNLSAMWVSGRGGDKDIAKAVPLEVTACEAGLEGSCLVAAGLAQLNGDAVQARELFAKTCEDEASADSVPACVALGRFMMLGEGGDKDAKQARVLFEKACEGGNMDGCYSLGLAHQKGLGGKKNKKAGAALILQACEGGHQPACG